MTHLSVRQVERFYRIWFPLLHYVNEQRQIIESFPAVWGDASVEPETAVSIRNVLWEDDTLRETFIAENPAGLTQEDLVLVESWKHRVTGNFFVFRYLKKYTVFLTGESPARGFGILGIMEPLEDIVGPDLPRYVQTTLLPFERSIIYDSLLSGYAVHFGGGYRHSLNETYRFIKEREGIITTLPTDSAPTRDRIRAGNKKLLSAFQKALDEAGLSPTKMQEHTDNIARFADEFLLLQEPSHFLFDVSEQDIRAYIEQTNDVNLVSFKRFVRFMRDSARMDWDEAETILEMLKRQQRN